MQFRSWICVTVCTLFLTAFALNQAGVFAKGGSRFARHATPRVQASAADLFASEAGARYRRCQATHWKYLILKR